MAACSVQIIDPGMAGTAGATEYPCTEIPIAVVKLACRHEHVDEALACAGCATELMMMAGAPYTCYRCDTGADEPHECPADITLTWLEGEPPTHVQDTEGRNLLGDPAPERC